MKVKNPRLLRYALRALPVLASTGKGVAAALVEGRICIEWAHDTLKLTATDGHRSCCVTLQGEATGVRDVKTVHFTMGDSDFALGDEARLPEMLFLGPEGQVRTMGTASVTPLRESKGWGPLGLSDGEVREQERQAAESPFGYEFRLSENHMPLNKLNELKAGIIEKGAGVRTIRLNPSYLQDALDIYSRLWSLDEMDGLPVGTFVLPTTPNSPVLLRATGKSFEVEMIISPYTSP